MREMAGDPSTKKSSIVESVLRALALLDELNRSKISSVDHLHRVTGLPKATIVRLLQTLCAAGYVSNDRRQGGYQVTSMVQNLSAGFHGAPMIVEACRTLMIDFTRKFQWPAALALIDYDAVVVRFSTVADSPISPAHIAVNSRMRFFTRALGRAYLAFCPTGEREMLLKVLATSSHPEDQVAKDIPRAMAILDATRHQRYADRDPQVEPRISSTLAVPVIAGDRVLASVGVTYFTSAVAKEKAVATYVPELHALAERIRERFFQLNT